MELLIPANEPTRPTHLRARAATVESMLAELQLLCLNAGFDAALAVSSGALPPSALGTLQTIMRQIDATAA